MKRTKLILSLFVLTVMLMMIGGVSANTIESSTMVFQGELTNNGDGSYSGVIGAIPGVYYMPGGSGCDENNKTPDGTDCVGGFDVYAKNGAWATYYNGSDYLEGQVTDHDAYTTAGGWGSWYDPDVADWNNYQLTLTSDSWALEYNGGTLGDAIADPMSGSMDWNNMYATETGTGAYYSEKGVPRNDGYAAQFAGNNTQSTAGAWDMDWSWGSEYVPLEHGGFLVDVENLGGGNYRVTLTPSTIYLPREGDYVSDSVQIAWDGTFGSAQLGYKEGKCNNNLYIDGILKSGIATAGTYNWDTSGLDDGEYCIKIVSSNKLYDEVEVVKDTTPPKIEFGYMELYAEAGKNFTINATITDDRDVAWYHIDFGDGSNGTSRRIWEKNLTTNVLENHTYVTEGRYTIVIWTRDEAGNMNNNSSTIVVTSEEPDWIIPLYKGLNFISIPFMPEITKVSDNEGVFSEVKCNIEAIWSYQYDESSGKNKWFIKTVSDTCGWGSQTAFDIVPGRGYVVKKRNTDVLYGNAKETEIDSEGNPKAPSNIVKLATRGYNLVGVFGNEELSEEDLNDKRISTGNVNTKVVQSVYNGDGTPLGSNNLTSKKAYWLSMNNLETNLPYYEYKL